MREWLDSRHVYYGTAAERAAFPAAGEMAGALFFDYDDELWYYWDGAAWQTFGAGGGAPANAQYVVMALDGTLTQERVLVDGTGTDVVDGGAGGNVQVNLDIGALAAETAAADTDEIAILKAAVHKRMTRGNLLNWSIFLLSGTTMTHYTDLATALAAAIANDAILLNVGQFTCNDLTIPNNVTVAGLDQSGTRLVSTSDRVITLGSSSILANCTVRNNKSSGSPTAVKITGSLAECREVVVTVTDYLVGSKGFETTGTQTLFSYCRSFDADYGVHNTSGTQITVLGGSMEGITAGAYSSGASSSILAAGLPKIPTVSGPIYGMYTDGTSILGGEDGYLDLDELAADPGAAGTNRWRLYPKSTGVFVQDDAGAVTGPLAAAPSGVDPAHTHSKLVASDGAPDPALSSDAAGNATGVGWTASDAHAFKIKNTSGGAVAANDVGYIDAAGEFKTTTTAYSDVAWCVAVTGGADNTDIYISRRGRVTVTLNGNCSAGDYLYTSTTAGRAQPQSYVRPELFAVALTANAGGAGGTCSALLLCNRIPTSLTNANELLFVSLADTADFVSTIATLPGGAVLTYGAVSSGAENCIVPSNTDILAKIRLYNSTRGTYGLIDTVVVGTNTVTLTANVPGDWQVGDTITARSQTNTANPAAGQYFFDFEIENATVIPTLAVKVVGTGQFRDSAAGAGIASVYHSWEANDNAKQVYVPTYLSDVFTWITVDVSLIQRRFCHSWASSGAGTGRTKFKLTGMVVATP